MIGLLLLQHYIANNCLSTWLADDDKQLCTRICMNKTWDMWYKTIVIVIVIVYNEGEVGYNAKDVQFNCNDQ